MDFLAAYNWSQLKRLEVLHVQTFAVIMDLLSNEIRYRYKKFLGALRPVKLQKVKQSSVRLDKICKRVQSTWTSLDMHVWFKGPSHRLVHIQIKTNAIPTFDEKIITS